MASAMKIVTGRVLASHPLVDDWEDGECLCQGPVPEDKKIEVQQRIYDEKRKKHRWRNFVRYHQDCPIHGCNTETAPCPEA